jgi:hypothetical protein
MIEDDFCCRLRVLILLLILVALALAGCLSQAPEKPDAPPDEITLAEATLREFFQALHEGEYENAVELYGGDYDPLISMNPDLDPSDGPALMAQGCEFNGFSCLRMGQVLAVERMDNSIFTIKVQFLTDDGEVFFLGPCCGAGETSLSPVSEFKFRVSQDGSGQYRVLDLPVYVP